MDLRCDSKKHAEFIEPGVIEVKCNSRICGSGNGVVVIHRFDTNTGKLLDTKRFREPREVTNGSSAIPAAVRGAAGTDH